MVSSDWRAHGVETSRNASRRSGRALTHMGIRSYCGLSRLGFGERWRRRRAVDARARRRTPTRVGARGAVFAARLVDDARRVDAMRVASGVDGAANARRARRRGRAPGRRDGARATRDAGRRDARARRRERCERDGETTRRVGVRVRERRERRRTRRAAGGRTGTRARRRRSPRRR